MTGPEGPLLDRTILVTRPPARAEELSRRLARLGARVEARPTIALGPPQDPRPAREAVAGVERYDWVVFTSVNGVRFFHELHDEIHGVGSRLACAVAAIGPATAAALTARACAPDVVATDSRSEGLARSLAGRVVRGQRVLIVRPETARPVLVRAIAGLGARADAVAFYRNLPAPGRDGIVVDLCADRFDAVIFSSPSSLERLIESRARPAAELLEALRRTRILAIGPVTAERVERAGLGRPAVADEPTDEALVEAVRGLFR